MLVLRAEDSLQWSLILYSVAVNKYIISVSIWSHPEQVAERVVDDRHQQRGEYGPVPELVLAVVLAVGEQRRNADQSRTVDHQPRAVAGQGEDYQVVLHRQT